MRRRSFKLLFLLSISSALYAKSPILVTSDTCKSLKHPKKPFTLVLKSGQDVLGNVASCMKAARVDSAAFMGLGALQDPSLAYFNSETKKYQKKSFAGDYELVALNGNYSHYQNEPVVHMHVGLGGPDFNMIAGHLMSGKVGATIEITVLPLQGHLQRKPNAETGLNLLG